MHDGRPRAAGRGEEILVVLLLAILAAYFQWHGNGYSSETSWYSDEPAHLVTSLMVHDWIAAGFPSPPLAWAENYYAHYPKVGLGRWPPAFYLAEAVWMLAVGAGRSQAVAFVGLCSLLLAWLVWRQLRRAYPGWLAAALAASLLSLAPMRWFGWAVMADVPLALAYLLAVLAWGRYLDGERWQDNLRFGFWASVAIMTKITGFMLVLTPVLSVALLRRWELVRRRGFWLAPAWVALVCGPWYLWAPGARYESNAGWLFAWQPLAAARVAGDWVRFLGPVLAALMALGLLAGLRRLTGAASAAIAGCAAAVPLAMTVRFLVSEPRMSLFCYPLLALLAGWGAGWVASRPRWGTWGSALVGLGLLVTVWQGVRDTARKDCLGMDEAAEALQRGALAKTTVLVSSDPVGEGTLIAETALREQRPTHRILRASSQLAESDWEGRRITPLVNSAAEISEFLDRFGVDVVVTDADGRPRLDYERFLSQALEQVPGRWRLIGAYPKRRACPDRGRPIAVYQRMTPAAEEGRNSR